MKIYLHRLWLALSEPGRFTDILLAFGAGGWGVLTLVYGLDKVRSLDPIMRLCESEALVAIPWLVVGALHLVGIALSRATSRIGSRGVVIVMPGDDYSPSSFSTVIRAVAGFSSAYIWGFMVVAAVTAEIGPPLIPYLILLFCAFRSVFFTFLEALRMRSAGR